MRSRGYKIIDKIYFLRLFMDKLLRNMRYNKKLVFDRAKCNIITKYKITRMTMYFHKRNRIFHQISRFHAVAHNLIYHRRNFDRHLRAGTVS